MIDDGLCDTVADVSAVGGVGGRARGQRQRCRDVVERHYDDGERHCHRGGRMRRRDVARLVRRHLQVATPTLADTVLPVDRRDDVVRRRVSPGDVVRVGCRRQRTATAGMRLRAQCLLTYKCVMSSASFTHDSHASLKVLEFFSPKFKACP